MKTVEKINKTDSIHWVGNGFPVRRLLSYDDAPEACSPFLMLDYAGPYEFTPTTQPRGVGEHPHRGFETVTIVYEGEVSHKDSMGTKGTIGPGDVQWMTAAGGILHEEFHSKAFAAKGGTFRLAQLWVNLPKKHKLTEPRYQALLNKDIPRIALANGAGELRVIAGRYEQTRGPAETFSPVNVWDVTLSQGATLELAIPAAHTTLLAVLDGQVETGGATLSEAELARFGASGADISITASQDAKFLILTGEPLNEPVYGHGPFVMSNEQEIKDAFNDLRNGKFAQRQSTEVSV